LIWNLGLAVVLWIVVAAVAVANHGQISQPPLYPKMTMASH